MVSAFSITLRRVHNSKRRLKLCFIKILFELQNWQCLVYMLILDDYCAGTLSKSVPKNCSAQGVVLRQWCLRNP